MGNPEEEDEEQQALVSGGAVPPAPASSDDIDGKRRRSGAAPSSFSFISEPIEWAAMLCRELNPTFVFGILLVYGLSQGLSGSFFKVASDYYWKDIQKAQPSSVQLYIGAYYIPWIMKPLWGILTDVFPISGYRRRPYFVLAGVLGAASSAAVAACGEIPAYAALMCLVGVTASMAIADVTIDACIARNSIERPELAADLQSLCGFVSSVGALVGYLSSGVVIHGVGAQGALGLMAVPAAMMVVLGFVFFERKVSGSQEEKRKVMKKLKEAVGGMGRTIRCPQVWKPSLYMFSSLALSISTHEGQFYWYTDSKAGPAFSQEFMGIVFAIGAMASVVGVLIYHKLLRACRFRRLAIGAQILYVASGGLDLAFILRWNLKAGLPDPLFVVFEVACSHIVGKLRWMPMMVLSARLCPAGVEGTFFALLMCIDSLGSLASKAAGAALLGAFGVTRTDFRRLWLVAFIRNMLRLATLALVFLVPDVDQSGELLPPDLLRAAAGGGEEEEELQLVDITTTTTTFESDHNV